MRYQGPSDTQRIVIVGATGSGKTNAGLWNLSQRNFDRKPWIIYDFKYDDSINRIRGIRHLSTDDPVPDQPGLYAVHPYPEEDIEPQMWDIWNRENVGVFIDEGLMVGRYNSAFRSLLSQGRSKHIPMIVLSQRPVWMDKYAYTESDYIQIFRLQNQKDMLLMQDNIPKEFSIQKRLPRYHSYYYDVNRDEMKVMPPVPDPDAILDTFDLRMETVPIRRL